MVTDAGQHSPAVAQGCKLVPLKGLGDRLWVSDIDNSVFGDLLAVQDGESE